MNQASIDNLQAVLEDIRAAIVQHPAFLRGSGSLLDDASFVTDRDTIVKLAAQLTQAQTLLKNDLANFDFREQLAFRSPREMRFRALQSHRDKSGAKQLRSSKLYNFAVDLAGDLGILKGTNNTVSVVDSFTSRVEFLHDRHVSGRSEKSGLDKHAENLVSAVTIPLDIIISLMVGYLAVAASKNRK